MWQMEKEFDVDGEKCGQCSVRSGHGMSMSQETFWRRWLQLTRELISGSSFLFKPKTLGFLF